MSDNYTLYVQKMAELRAARDANRPLHRQIEALFQVVRECEARWALAERGDGA
jgi:hypothetical protein